MFSAIFVGWVILPAAVFQAALSGQARIFAFGHRRLKAGGSQDWLPHFFEPVLVVTGAGA